VSILKNIQQQRGIPIPLGIPTVPYVPYSFGNMKKLHVIPYTVDLTIPLQTFVNIFIPANTWGEFKIMILKFGYTTTLVSGHDTSNATIAQYYSIDPTSSVFQGSCVYDSPLAAFGNGVLEFRFIRIGADIFDYSSYQLDGVPLIGRTATRIRLLKCNGITGLIDFSNSFEFKQIIDVIGALAGDTLQITWAQADIQSPLDLGRLPR